MFHENDTAIPLESQSSNWAFEPILHERFNIMRARCFNLVDSIIDEDQEHRARAVKGLMRDFINMAYYDSLRAIESFLREKKVIPDGEDQSGYMPLAAKSLDDVHVRKLK